MPSIAGITPIPFLTAISILETSGLISFKFGPIIALDPASERVWHAAQLPASRKISFPLLNNSSALALISHYITKKMAINNPSASIQQPTNDNVHPGS